MCGELFFPSFQLKRSFFPSMAWSASRNWDWGRSREEVRREIGGNVDILKVSVDFLTERYRQWKESFHYPLQKPTILYHWCQTHHNIRYLKARIFFIHWSFVFGLIQIPLLNIMLKWRSQGRKCWRLLPAEIGRTQYISTILVYYTVAQPSVQIPLNPMYLFSPLESHAAAS